MKTKILGLLVLALSAGPMAATAANIYFGEDTGLGESTPLTSYPNATAARNSFFSNLTGVETEDFESFATGTGSGLIADFGAAGTATLSGGGNVASVTPGTTNGVGRYAISGSKYWETSSSGFTLTFANPIAAFGFFGVDIGDFNGQITLALVGGGTANYTVNNTKNGPGGSVLYWGIIDVANPFTSITFGNTAAGSDFFGFDDFSIGTAGQVTPTPEPGTLALLGLGLAGLGLSRRRRTH